MKFEIGKVTEFNGCSGKIISKSGSYLFLDKDIINNGYFEIGDYVIFRGEKVEETNRAFFVQLFSKKINNIMVIKSNLARLLKRDDK